jgi:hypothetical protein
LLKETYIWINNITWHLKAGISKRIFSLLMIQVNCLLFCLTVNSLQVYRDCCRKSADRPYLRHRLFKRIGNMEFCPYEDVLGVATESGFTSLIIPGKIKPEVS